MEESNIFQERLLSQAVAQECVKLMAYVADLKALLSACSQISPECAQLVQETLQHRDQYGRS